MASITQRLGMALKALIGPRASLMLPTWQAGQPIYEMSTFQNYIQHGYTKNELIYGCISAHQSADASVRYAVQRKSDGETLDDHPIRALLAHPNPHMSEYEFHWLTTAFLYLAGKAYWEKVYDSAGNLIQLWPLRPDFVQIVPGDRGSGELIKEYLYAVPGVAEIHLPPKQVLAFRNPNPLDWYHSLPPVQIASRTGDVDNSVTDFIKLFFERGTMPPGILTSKNKLTDPQVGEIKRRWSERYGGFNRWFEPAVMDADMSYQKTSASFAEMQFDQIDARSEVRICMALRVPPILIGAIVGLRFGTYSNYEEARKSWWEDVKSPEYKRRADALTLGLAGDFDTDITDIEIVADLSDVPALKEAEAAKWTRADQSFAGGIITRNEAREYIGFESLGPVGDVFASSMGIQYTPKDEMPGQQPPAPPQNDPLPPPPADTLTAEAQKALTKITAGEIQAAQNWLKDTYGYPFVKALELEVNHA